MRGMFRSGGPYHLHALRSHSGLSWLQLQNEEVFGVQAPNREQSGLTRGGEKRWGKVWPSFGQQTNRHGRKVNNFPQYVHQVISQLPIFSTISKIIQKTYKKWQILSGTNVRFAWKTTSLWSSIVAMPPAQSAWKPSRAATCAESPLKAK